MIPDLNFAVSAFNRFNASIFNSGLPTPGFALTRARTFRGKLRYTSTLRMLRREIRDPEIRLSTSFDLPEREWEDVMIHEMIHLHIVSKGIKDSSSHGPVFRSLMNEINKTHGRKITVSAKSSDSGSDPDKRIRAHYLCIAKFNDGRHGVAPVIKSRIFSLWDHFNCFPGVAAVRWVGTTDPWFNRFPRVMKPKLYIADRTELLRHIKGGRLLERTGNIIRPVSRHCSPDELLP